MHIDFSSSGGLANLQLEYRADTDELPKEQAEEILTLIESSGALNLEPNDINPTVSSGPPDVVSYRLTLSEGGKQKTFWFNDVTAPASLRPLLTLLRKRALEQKRKGT